MAHGLRSCVVLCTYACSNYCVCHLIRVLFFDDADGSLAEQLSGVDSFVHGGDFFSFPQVQRTASQVQSRDGTTADVSVVILAARQVA